MNLPNKITIFRILLVPVFVVSMIINKTNNLWPCIIFIVASVTDTLDGNIARKYNLVTTFGKFMDPLADKILTAAAFIMLVELGKIPAWICIIILSRELIITAFRTIAASEGITIAASPFGKLKTIFQMLAIILLLGNNMFFINYGIPMDQIMLYICLFFTVLSGIDYIIKNKKVLDLKNI